MNKRFYRVCFFLAVLLSAGMFGACNQGPGRAEVISQMMQESLEARVKSFKRVRMERCREGLIEQANQIVDSMLQAELKYTIDTLGRPPRPKMPKGREKKELRDSSEVRPFLEDSTLQQ